MIQQKEVSESIIKDNDVFKGSIFVIYGITCLFKFGRNQKINLSLLLRTPNFFPGNETNYKMKWGAFSQKKESKCTEYCSQRLNLTIFSKLNIQAFFILAHSKLIPGNETNYKMKWVAFSQEKDSKYT